MKRLIAKAQLGRLARPATATAAFATSRGGLGGGRAGFALIWPGRGVFGALAVTHLRGSNA